MSLYASTEMAANQSILLACGTIAASNTPTGSLSGSDHSNVGQPIAAPAHMWGDLAGKFHCSSMLVINTNPHVLRPAGK